MLTAYMQAAMQQARFEWLPHDKTYYGEIPVLPGVWATGTTVEATRDELQEVLEDWIVLGLTRNHVLPSIDGLTLLVSSPS
ncbi:MAG: type II toxin-antitoxin system HicB family antitoxin [Dehalococcoidia bacterium]